MDLTGDGVHEALAEAMPGRALRYYRAVTSTDADAISWVRSGAPEGSVVVAETSISPRGHGERPWKFHAGRSLAFTMILRPLVPPLRQGWLYMLALMGIADTVGGDRSTVEWPAELLEDDRRLAAVAVKVAPEPGRILWAVVNVIVPEPPRPRVALLAQVVEAIEGRYRQPPEELREDYLTRCTTIGRSVCARLVPLGPAGRRLVGRAVDVRSDGALMIEIEEGRPVPARPQNVGILEDAPTES
ncbi:MAG: biotin--[acetyl-CoA-carboxylase] ligase [Candidatus Dormibacteria bacterium]